MNGCIECGGDCWVGVDDELCDCVVCCGSCCLCMIEVWCDCGYYCDECVYFVCEWFDVIECCVGGCDVVL